MAARPTPTMLQIAIRRPWGRWRRAGGGEGGASWREKVRETGAREMGLRVAEVRKYMLCTPCGATVPWHGTGTRWSAAGERAAILLRGVLLSKRPTVRPTNRRDWARRGAVGAARRSAPPRRWGE